MLFLYKFHHKIILFSNNEPLEQSKTYPNNRFYSKNLCFFTPKNIQTISFSILYRTKKTANFLTVFYNYFDIELQY